MTKSEALLDLARQAGFDKLTDAERKLLLAAPIGEFAVCGPNQKDDDPENDPSKGDSWPESRQIRAKLIRWLCVDEAARKLIDPKGIQIYGAKVIDPLDLDFVSVSFPIRIVRSRILSPIFLIHANIEALYLNGTLTGPITADGLTTRGDIFLNDGFRADGEVRFLGATVGGELNCSPGTFVNAKKYALNCAGVKVASSVLLRLGFGAAGEVNLVGATIGGSLECAGATFMPGSVLNLEGARISRNFWWAGITDGWENWNLRHEKPHIKVDLAGASAAFLADDESGWPSQGNLHLNKFTYDAFAIVTIPGTVVPRDADSRLRWLRLQDRSGGLPTQPYKQLAKVLESSGDERGARKVRIAMENDLLPSLRWRSLGTYLWRQILRGTISYGYKPWKALWWVLALVLIGSLSFARGYRAGVIVPTDQKAFADFRNGQLSPGYPPFNAFIYSLDTFLPIINLGLKDKWMPSPNQPDPGPAAPSKVPVETCRSAFVRICKQVAHWSKSGHALRGYLVVHVLLGWALISLFVAGFTGIIRR